MLVLITGGAGFIGGHAAAAFAAGGWDVRTLDVAAGGATGVDAVPGDVRDPATLDRCLDGVDVVCHQAAKVGLGVSLADMPDYTDVNCTGTAALLAAMAGRGVGRLVLASSMVIYGEGGYACPAHGPVRAPARTPADLAAGRFEPRCACGADLHPLTVTEDATPDPRNAYAASKLAQEHLAAVWARETGGTAVALRYHNVYGPGMPRDTPYAGVAAIFRSALLRGEPPRVFEDGAQRRDFVHVRDVAAACVSAARATAAGAPEAATGDAGHAERPASARGREAGLATIGYPEGWGAAPPSGGGADDARPPDGVAPGERRPGPRSAAAGELRAYNVGSGTPRTVGDLAAALAAAHGGPQPVVTGEYRLGDVRHITADSTRIRDELAFHPRVPFADGVAEFAAEPTEPVATTP